MPDTCSKFTCNYHFYHACLFQHANDKNKQKRSPHTHTKISTQLLSNEVGTRTQVCSPPKPVLLSGTSCTYRHPVGTPKRDFLSPNPATPYPTLGWAERGIPAPLIQPSEHGQLKPQAYHLPSA